MFCWFTLDQSYEHYFDLFRLDNVLFVHTWSILWTLFGLVQTGQCFVGSHLINLMNIIWTCSDWTMFCWFTLDQSYEHYFDLFRLDNVLFVHTWSILWTLFWLVQTRQCFICSHLINLMNIIWTCSDWTMFCWFRLWMILWTLFGLCAVLCHVHMSCDL
jgi:hypothetical protein